MFILLQAVHKNLIVKFFSPDATSQIINHDAHSPGLIYQVEQ
jgi:hypothetical protein